MRITSADNPQYRHCGAWPTSPRACRESGRTLAEGMHLVECAGCRRASIQTVVLSEAAAPDARSLG